MKRNYFLTVLLATASLFTLNSCLEDTAPESEIVTAEQISASPDALEATVNGIPAQMVQGYLVYGDQVHETDMAYPQLMIAQTEMLGDMYPGIADNAGYDWYRRYNSAPAEGGMGPNSYFAFLPWYTLYKFVKMANGVIGNVDLNNPSTSDLQKAYAGIGYACRAFDYYMLTVLFEPKANKYTDCSKVLGLTVPKVTEATSEEESFNNPRLPHAEMIQFILSDLDMAEQLLTGFTPDSRLVPDLAVVYGLKAKVYLWDEQYAKAAEYARKAIDAQGGVPMTAAEYEDPGTGFAQATSGWMWYLHYSAENMRNLANFTGWISGEADWSYSSLYMPVIDKSLYDKMRNSDIRKHVFLDPGKTKFYNYKTCRDADFIKEAPDYLSLKFRCLGGSWEDYTTGGAVDVPIMRVEEMYLIEAEAVGVSQGVAAGLALLNSFMQNYRDPKYAYNTDDLREFQLEVLTQMRIEFWGEGNAFPSAKRLQPGVMQNYAGTNAPTNALKINLEGMKPSWNLVIPYDEYDYNKVLKTTNNPDPDQTIKYPSPEGQYSQPK